MLTVTLFAIATAFAAESQPANTFPHPIHSTQLDNGLTLHVVPMGTPDVAAVYVWFGVGSRDEVDEGRTGFAHFFEHLVFYGTPSLPGPQRERRILQLGAEENAWTWRDETVYHAVLPASRVEDYLDVQADVFQNLHLTPDDIQKEAGAVYGEFRKSQADPGDAASMLLYGTAFQTHTYHHDTIGFEADIAQMPTAHDYAMSFFDRYYRPENATVLITGDIDPVAVTQAVAERFGPWARGSAEPKPIPEEPAQTERRSAELDWPTPTAPQLLLGWKSPASDPSNETFVALGLVDQLLFSEVGGLEQRLVRDEGIAYSVWGGRDDTVDPGLFTVTVLLKDRAQAERAEAIIAEEIAALRGVDPDALDRARTRDRYAVLTGLSAPGRVASTLGWATRRNPDPEALSQLWAATAQLIPEDLAAAIDATFTDQTLTTVLLSYVDDEEGAP